MKEQIVEILLDTLSYAYCDNCGNAGEECECYRKYQQWKLGRPTAEKIADKIIENVIKPVPEEWKFNNDEIIQNYQKMLKDKKYQAIIDGINNIGLINPVSKEELNEI